MQVRIDKLVPGGQGIGTLDTGQKAFIWGALPGEVIEFETTKSKKSYVEGVTASVLSDISSHRIEPRDQCYFATSPWQILDYDYELEQKREIILELMRQNDISADVQPVLTDGRDFEYRNKMEYSLYYDHDTEKIHPAFHIRGTHRKIPVSQSSIERPEIWSECQRMINELNSSGADARDYQSIMIRCSQSGKVSSALYENHKPRPEMAPLTDVLLGHEYSYSPSGFFQINLPVYEMALNEIGRHITTDKVLDLYAGVGTIGLSVAGNRNLTLIEINASAFEELERNVATRAHATPVLAKSEDVLDYIQPDATVILDPPRAGCDQKLINKLIEVKPPTVIYLSCNPATQMRDIKPLLDHYQITQIQPYNFFPRTPHIENLILLERN